MGRPNLDGLFVYYLFFNPSSEMELVIFTYFNTYFKTTEAVMVAPTGTEISTQLTSTP